MAVQVSDHLPEGDPDPLRDDPPAPAPEPVAPIEPALDEVPQPATEEVPAEEPSAEETDWKKRYDDLRTGDNRALQEARRQAEEATRTRDEALRLARQVYENARRAEMPTNQIPSTIDQNLVAEAEQLGISVEQLQLINRIAEQKAREQAGQFETRYAQDRARALEEQAASQSMAQVVNVREQFAMAHPDAVEKAPEILEFMQRVGAVSDQLDETGHYPVQIDNFSMGDLEAAWEAVQNPDLAFVLKAQPDLYYSAEGMEMARRQVQADQQRASLAELLAKAEPVTTPTIDPRRTAALAAAETLPASGGPPPTAGGPPQDEFDEAVAMWQGKRKSAFSS